MQICNILNHTKALLLERGKFHVLQRFNAYDKILRVEKGLKN
jgi:hypothetical protein